MYTVKKEFHHREFSVKLSITLFNPQKFVDILPKLHDIELFIDYDVNSYFKQNNAINLTDKVKVLYKYIKSKIKNLTSIEMYDLIDQFSVIYDSTFDDDDPIPI